MTGMSPKFVRKYMRLARQMGTDGNECPSRQIGVILVDPLFNNKILGAGYNSPPRETPHCYSSVYLHDVVWPQLTKDEKVKAMSQVPQADVTWPNEKDEEKRQTFCSYFGGLRRCPREIIGASSGHRKEICSCQHAERNAISNASCNLRGAYAFCWCGVPCLDCAGALINVQIGQVYCLRTAVDYSYGSRFLFKKAEIPLMELEESYFQGETL